ncbi:M23 family metallopeptidase [Candidatus Pacearchaeota archaeon]|nr:M23 family metallopeptidase [Candidatus Pacearchaeota archaeon]
MISPTGKSTVRSDSKGSGLYGARRGGSRHKGTDYVCVPGQPVVAPISGVVVRKAKPYEGEEYSGVVIQGENMRIKMFYLQPLHGLIGTRVEQGQLVGCAQDISGKYGKNEMMPHIHLQIDSINPDIFINGLG